mmetsp:Transcript_29068/g.65179  ORF Transcript_29068/g.65179 Transcript_29068/m.65179 type:complete len:81 (+) Transcript_29068:2349-2591(+)
MRAPPLDDDDENEGVFMAPLATVAGAMCGCADTRRRHRTPEPFASKKYGLEEHRTGTEREAEAAALTAPLSFPSRPALNA